MTAIPKGFLFAAHNAGLRYKDRNDVALLVSETEATAAAVFTTNKFQAAPVLVGQDVLAARRTARAVLINAGQANACTGSQGLADCRESVRLVAEAVGVPAGAVLPGSTGVIGARMAMDKWPAGAQGLAAALGTSSHEDFARAIMTTDAFPKIASERVKTLSGEFSVLGMAKGAGMICPNMATLLVVVLTDAAVDADTWQDILNHAVAGSFNAATVDGDTSTNDTVYALANGASGVGATPGDTLPYVDELGFAVDKVCQELAYMLVADGEGATKVARIVVTGARDNAQAETVARTVGHSQLVKTALYGKDANWGRIVAAVGRSGADFDAQAVVVQMGGVTLFENGMPAPGDLDALLAPHLERQEVRIDISLGSGQGAYTLLASDLTHDYVSVNADYRS
ncbi:MAG: bifunctional glutamate N-acetyltransferase/amino-acid acetyltransferase ArgJ [Desulfovibrionaceae bacterium]